MKINYKATALALSVGFSFFTLCSLQFYDIGDTLHDSWEEEQKFKYETYAPDNLSGTIEYLELIEEGNILHKKNIPLSKTQEWKESKTKIDKYTQNIKDLETELAFHKQATSKIRTQLSKIQLRNSMIGLLIIIGSLIFGMIGKKQNNNES
ncbi:hypothetical protein PQO03_07485 [Lentisphaera profundi]|uniref:Chemotaxis methyl-accepting receptor HlyB-like 4HB MCP domain-containing protein n=1 Tax=Lentisphaera profundi TaxID=1658616 RepID=A0ABY7VQP5_9BACT|nr:hypothetical protein [Lentisphaera profundi]WDE95560.1 hypothetical protein PQO03_07485 [Lentisphaera profundi]